MAGVRTPKPVLEMAHDPEFASTYKQLEKVREKLEKKFGDVQDFEFTVEKKKLYMLQTRNGKRTGPAAVRIAVEKAAEFGHDPTGAVLASDAFFPFADGPQLALDAGVTAIVQPGGSRRDDEVATAIGAAGAAMVFTGARHFRH